MIERKALAHLRSITNNANAQFHDGQLDAILKLVKNKKQILVVQKTGWGKSAVYFIATKLLVEQGRGPSIIISPLIALMRNQIKNAAKLGLKIVTVNSSLSKQDRKKNEEQISNRQVDSIIIAPEQLANDYFVENILSNILSTVSLLVVDEAHCISDWGHDFRPDYRRIVRILQTMPSNLPVLATTATANNRVVSDIQKQLGNHILISRGSLTRKALHLQTLPRMNKVKRLAWLVQALNQIQGTGIIYAKTVRDCELVSDWLRANNINSQSYSGASDSYNRIALENDLLDNKLKVLVSTSALGMGFDKPDISFVIHFQAPGNIVEYYQQVGRAGRGIENAYGILMFGNEDERIQEFFIRNAFPNQREVDGLLQAISDQEGLKKSEIEKHTNLSYGKIEKALRFLSSEDPSPIYKDGASFYRTAIDYSLPLDRIERLSAIKTEEWEQLLAYGNHQNCLMRFLVEALDNPLIENCGKCENCDINSKIPIELSNDLIVNATKFLKCRYVKIKPRKQLGGSVALAKEAFPIYQFPFRNAKLVAEEGLALSRWKDGFWGSKVAENKATGKFSDELIEPMLEMIQGMNFQEPPCWITYVPSPRHPVLVKDFAHKLAAALNIHCADTISIANERPPQKNMENSYQRSSNLDGAFKINLKQVYCDPVLLLDDAVDSGWTFAVISALLKNSGSGKVYPIALTSTSNQG